MEPLLDAMLSREAVRAGQSRCRGCMANNWAVWRCVDCTLPPMLCRKCMRQTHAVNPLHQIQKWTGKYFRAAALWEVGTYILVPHHDGEAVCLTLEWQIRYLDGLEAAKDEAEQEAITVAAATRMAWHEPAITPDVDRGPDEDHDMADATPEVSHTEDEDEQDAAFERFLNALHNSQGDDTGDGNTAETHQGYSIVDDGAAEPGDDTVVGEADNDIPELPGYLHGSGTFSAAMPRSDDLQNSYVRVVHTNGIHHLAMVSCECRGQGNVPLDLMACRMAPASFERIRTLFSGQMLDYFRLCNLELKASAYQFYQLLRRITMPMCPAEVVNLYNEFRRMSRLWRWMKKLKWSGFGHHKRDPNSVQDGELAIYCPACPQPGVNIPSDWKENDRNR